MARLFGRGMREKMTMTMNNQENVGHDEKVEPIYSKVQQFFMF